MLGELATPEAVASLRKSMGLDRALVEQYARYMGRTLQGDLGLSIRARRPVVQVILERAPATVRLTLAAATIATAIGIPVGVLAAARRGSGPETLAFALSLVGQAMPAYWLGLILISVFSVELKWLPVSGMGSLSHIVLPAITLAAFVVGLVVRLTRSAMLDVLGEDYVRTARAKGLSEARVLFKHGLRPALIPVMTVLALQVGTLLGGAVITETIFAWPGIGGLAVLAIFQRDYPVIQALVLLSALTFVVINFVIDVLYAVLDPRITFDSGRA